ncbi:MAG: hypothetical protein KDI55_09255, partial [Anaerolineae bacterium]|nr:hypothetical protein [Anaerolineae bacterium]
MRTRHHMLVVSGLLIAFLATGCAVAQPAVEPVSQAAASAAPTQASDPPAATPTQSAPATPTATPVPPTVTPTATPVPPTDTPTP